MVFEVVDVLHRNLARLVFCIDWCLLDESAAFFFQQQVLFINYVLCSNQRYIYIYTLIVLFHVYIYIYVVVVVV